MTQPSLEQQKLAQLAEAKIWNFNHESQKIADKWQNWAKKKRQSVNHLENS